MEALYVFAALVALAAGIYSLNCRLNKKRTEALAGQAVRAGLDFRPHATPDINAFYPMLPLEGSGTITNVCIGAERSLNFWLFDYIYRTGTGKNRATFSLSASCFQSGGRALPEFTMSPEHFGCQIAAFFGCEDIDIPEAASFSKLYFLKGKDESSVRAFFHKRITDYFEAHPGLSVRAEGDKLIFLAPRIKPAKLHAHLSLMKEGAQMFFGV